MNLGEKGDFESKSAIKNVIIQIDDQKINGYSVEELHQYDNYFTQLFVSERKQIAVMADEKSLARISHRLLANNSLGNED